ncbi:MAG: hypothetical protein GWO87_01015 [Xanthomonadaceae bacterium]|nr:hypothetical protein [Rhodospirillaceae bacterium]NIA17755.1 hypothetical protein [Xanthomonadaceae bacterium]
MSHFCKNVLIRCMDFRLNNEVDKWIKNSNFFEHGYDLISVAGASKRIAEEGKEILGDVSVSANLHHVEKIIIMHHSDCGAYAQSYNFSSPDEEKEKQFFDMKKSEKILKSKYPHLEIIKVWAELLDNKGKKIKFSIVE